MSAGSGDLLARGQADEMALQPGPAAPMSWPGLTTSLDRWRWGTFLLTLNGSGTVWEMGLAHCVCPGPQQEGLAWK